MFRKFADVDVYKADPIVYELDRFGSNSKLIAVSQGLRSYGI